MILNTKTVETVAISRALPALAFPPRARSPSHLTLSHCAKGIVASSQQDVATGQYAHRRPSYDEYRSAQGDAPDREYLPAGLANWTTRPNSREEKRPMLNSPSTPQALLKFIATATAVIALIGVAAEAESQGARPASAKMPPVNDGLPMPGFVVTTDGTAIVVTDPQNDFLSPDGVTWGVVGQSITENGTVENIGDLFAVAEQTGMPVFVSPHYYYEHDHEWLFEGTLETLMQRRHVRPSIRLEP